MWVIFNADTGYEIDRVEDYDEMKAQVRALNENDVWGYSYEYRWED